jgi:adenylate kinase
MSSLILRILILIAPAAFATTNVMILGAPGSGKSTAGRAIAERYGVPFISSGDLVRAQIKLGTPYGLAAKEIAERGGLMPDTDEAMAPLVAMLREELSKPGAAHGFVLEGFPRSAHQAKLLDDLLRSLGRRLDAAVLIDIPHDVIRHRLIDRRICPHCHQTYNVGTRAPKVPDVCDACGTGLVRRKDDEPEVVERRLKLYSDASPPIEAFYRAQNQLITVDGQKLNAGGLDALYTLLEKPYPRGYLQERIPAHPDPSTGVRMYNLVEMWKDVGLIEYLVDEFRGIIDELKPDYLAAPEARALPIFGALIYQTKTPGIFIRKAGKIPAAVPKLSQKYQAATSAVPNELEMTEDKALEGKTVILIDDGLSTGGTTAATVELLERAGMRVVHVLSAIQYHYRGPCDEFLRKNLGKVTTTKFDLN